jgi:hypothetical protein
MGLDVAGKPATSKIPVPMVMVDCEGRIDGDSVPGWNTYNLPT